MSKYSKWKEKQDLDVFSFLWETKAELQMPVNELAVVNPI